MMTDPTVPQGGEQRRHAQQMSLERTRPPMQVPGYEFERLIGVGSYGEVWVAVESNTSRRVAIKFYSHRGGLDWSLLSREVEKLAFLFADRYVVQLIGVGWDAEPPYYIMEYLERGSLAERIQEEPIPADEAVAIFHDVAVGLLHAHGKGVLHCDLKPANVLLDQDGKPRLADFGQSRLSHEQTPALGTLFYMAPEQADLEAVPDARWDVYALGALLYCMLTGSPPYRTPEVVEKLEGLVDLTQRLSAYRRTILTGRTPTLHRQIPGVDRPLAEIIDRCLARDPKKRFPNIQAVLASLNARETQRARRPMMILGAVGPALILAVVSLFAWQGFSKALRRSEHELTRRALESNRFAAEFVARTAGNELERRFEAVERVASSPELRVAMTEALMNPEMQSLLEKLSDPEPLKDEASEERILEPLREEFRNREEIEKLQTVFDSLIPKAMYPKASGTDEKGRIISSWFLCDAHGVSTARVEKSKTLGKNYAWRSYFHGGPRDLEHEWQRPPPDQRPEQTKLSAVFRSQANAQWIVAVTAPVFSESPKRDFLGVVALTIKLGQFEEMERKERKTQFAVLVDQRQGDHTGVILQHSLQDELQYKLGKLSDDELSELHIGPERLPNTTEKAERYHDPLAERVARSTPGPHTTRWLAQMAPVRVRSENIGWVVIVQEAYDTHEGTIGATLSGLRGVLLAFGVLALLTVVILLLGLWVITLRLLRVIGSTRLFAAAAADATELPIGSSTPEVPTEPHRTPFR